MLNQNLVQLRKPDYLTIESEPTVCQAMKIATVNGTQKTISGNDNERATLATTAKGLDTKRIIVGR